MNIGAQPDPKNPLSAFMRQPKIYIRLPSNGEYWPNGSLKKTDTGEYPIYSMTAHDELLLKIPDALMNGQAVADLIQHCMPNVIDGWSVPAIDLDVILIAIRIATYGEQLSTSLTLGETELEYKVDLRTVLDSLMNQISWDPYVSINEDLTIFVKPVDYRHVTKMALQNFETQKIIQIANDDKLSEDEKIKFFKESFSKLSEITIGLVAYSVFKIESSQGSTDDPKFIQEFIYNIDKDIFNKIQDHLEKLRDHNSIKPVVITVTDELREQGFTGETIEVPLTFDASSFFV
jgi:hypothetical protein